MNQELTRHKLDLPVPNPVQAFDEFYAGSFLDSERDQALALFTSVTGGRMLQAGI